MHFPTIFMLYVITAERSTKPVVHTTTKQNIIFARDNVIQTTEKNSIPYYEQNSYKGVRKPGESKQVYHRNYCKNHPENIAHYKSRRYAVEKGAKGNHTKAEWDELKERFNHRCAICGEKKPLTVDHIIPLSKGGSDDISNIQPLCRNCNSKKSNKLDYSQTS